MRGWGQDAKLPVPTGGKAISSSLPLRWSVLLWRLSALVFALIFFTQCTIGLVTDYGPRTALSGATIQVGGKTGTTDSLGIFAIQGVGVRGSTLES